MSHRQSIAILTYHSLDDSGSVLSTSPRLFAEHMILLSQLDADIVSLRDLGRKRSGNYASKPTIAITFDDGFQNVYEYGFPVLQNCGFPATIFLVTDYCGGTNSWPSQPPGIRYQPLLNWQQIKEMSRAGITFGSHTRTHPDLTTIATCDVEEEMVGSKRAIEDALGVPVNTFAYPYGSLNEGVKKVAGTHFNLACSTLLGFVDSRSNSLALERLDMHYLRRVSLLSHLFTPIGAFYIHCRRLVRELRRHLPIRAF
jgi:peptidoglycan/xylan/chitin deacetylase (PgdA/CDA1 family)